KVGTDVGNAVASTSGRMGQGIFANAASRGFTIEVGELQRAGTIYDREHLEFLRNEYNREVLGRGVLTSEELIARIHQAQKDFDDFTGLSTIVTLPGGGMVMKGGLKLAARVLQIRRVARGVTQSFKSFSAFKRAMGPAGPGKAWHHIVEQNPANIAKFGAEAIHTMDNMIKLPHGAGSIHARISGFYSSKQAFTGGQTVRQWLSTQSYQAQYDFGIKTLKQFGWTP
ncbi:MAG: hypothetical protein AAGI25_20385, partial [Bacteroidota bacterium]